MPKFMKSVIIPIVSTPPSSVPDSVVIYGTNNGIGQSAINGNSNFDVAGDVIEFSFSDVSPIFIGKSQTNLTISEIIIEIITPFDNVNTTITVGDSSNHARLFPLGSIDVSSADKITCNPDYKYNVETDIYLYITGVNTIGNGIVRMYFN